MKNKKTNKKLMSTVAVASAFAVVVGGAFAFFNDTANMVEDIKIGNVDIDVKGDLLHSKELNNLNPGDNDPTVSDQSRPGTDHELSFKIENKGNKSVITRTVIEISGIRADKNTVLTEEELMNIILSEKANVTDMTTQGTIANTDINKQTEVVRLTPTGYSDNKLVYVVGGTRGNQDVLNGIGDNAEIEDGVLVDKLVKTFDIGLDKSSKTYIYAGSIITINVKVEAMQYRNTNDGNWETIFEKAYTTGGAPEAAELSTTLIKGLDFAYNVPTGLSKIKFTDEVAPDWATDIKDLSAAQDGGVVSWVDWDTLVISTQRPGINVVANPDCSYMFALPYQGAPLYCMKLIDLTNLDTSNVTNMECMFSGLELLESIVLPEGFNTSNVTNMEGMFKNLPDGISITLPSTFDTSKVINMKSMFENTNWSNLILPEAFDTSNADVTDMFKGFTGYSTFTVGSKFKFTGNGTYNDNSYPYGYSGLWTNGSSAYDHNKLPDNVADTYSAMK